MLGKTLGTEVPTEGGWGIFPDWTMQKSEPQTFLKSSYPGVEAIPLLG